jgi:hypothetical protein
MAFAQSDEDFDLEKEKLELEKERQALEREWLAFEKEWLALEAEKNKKKNKEPHNFNYNEGEWHLRISVLWLGGGAGFDYYHSNNHFFNVGASAVVMNALNNWRWDQAISIYTTFSNNHRNEAATVGYGLSYAGIYGSKSYTTFGLFFPAYVYFNKALGIGAVYRPTFFRPNMKEKFKYEYFISLELAFKIRLVKK